jgi:hypothetical protein
MKEMRNAFRILVENREGKIALGAPRSRWKDTVKMDIISLGTIWLKIVQSGRLL